MRLQLLVLYMRFQDKVLELVDVWLTTKFNGGRHKVRIDKIEQ